MNANDRPQLELLEDPRCPLHPAFEADYCPSCGTARPVGMTTAEAMAWGSSHTVGPVCIDDVVSVLAEYDPRQRWNGWLAAPHVDAWSVEAVFDALRPGSEYLDRPDFRTHEWREDGALVVVEYDGDTEYSYVIEPNADGLYALGAYAWVWSEDGAL